MENVSPEVQRENEVTFRGEDDCTFEHQHLDETDKLMKQDKEDGSEEGEDGDETIGEMSADSSVEEEKADLAADYISDLRRHGELNGPKEGFMSYEDIILSKDRAPSLKDETKICSVASLSADLSRCPGPDDFVHDEEILTQDNAIGDLLDEVCTSFASREDNILCGSPLEPPIIHEGTLGRLKCTMDSKSPRQDPSEKKNVKKEILRNVEDIEKENLVREGPLSQNDSVGRTDSPLKESPCAFNGQSHLLPNTTHKSTLASTADPTSLRKANKKDGLQTKPLVHECLKPINEAPKFAVPKNLKQRQKVMPVNCRSRRRHSYDGNDNKFCCPSSRLADDHEDNEVNQNGSRASIESSPCLRQRGCINFDHVRRFSSLHLTTRSSSRMEKTSLRGGKVDRVAR
ncbi:hypothetical protein KP509_11G019100 [Ceratopteris richardii]|nr:hypothetical protein KP509_11G019100 [Ceratopteris richardii]